MRIRIGITFALAVAGLLAASCMRLEYKEDIKPAENVFRASFEEAGSVSKTYMDSDHKLLWTKDDRISIFRGNTYNQQYRYKGETGENSAVFEVVSQDFYTGNDISANFSVYPYMESTRISNDELITLELPAVQHYLPGSFGPGANTMVAVTGGTDDSYLPFKNLCGFVVVKLYGEGTVTSISFKGNDGEKISGPATVRATHASVPEVVMQDEAAASITLDCGEGVTLGTTPETATEFWFCIPPVTFSKGFTVTAANDKGWTMVKSTSASRTVVRNVWSSMAALEAKFDTPAGGTIPPDDEIWYVSRDNKLIQGYQLTKGSQPFDRAIISHTYENGLGVMKFDGPVGALNADALRSLSILGRALTKLYLPNSIASIGDRALAGQVLEEFRVPDNLQTLSYNAFGMAKIGRFTGEHTFDDGRGILLDGVLCALNYDEECEELVIPASVEAIGPCLLNTGFVDYCLRPNMKYLTVSEGVSILNSNAFQFCKALKTVTLPRSLRRVDFDVFKDCPNIEEFAGNSLFVSDDGKCFLVALNVKGNVEFAIQQVAMAGMPDEYVTQKGPVEICRYAFEGVPNLKTVVVNDDVIYIDEGSFSSLPKLEAIILPANLETISGDCFKESGKLKTIYFRSIIPPSSVNGNLTLASYDGLKVYVPEQSLQQYKTSSGLSALKEYMEGIKYDDIQGDQPDYVSSDYSSDGVVRTLQTATEGNGVDLVLMGDAFSDRQIADGTYDKIMQKAVDAFFSEEPYKTFKSFFNVNVVYAVSATEGYKYSGQVFSTGHGEGTRVFGDNDRVFDYAGYAISESRINDAVIIVMMNEDAYAGTCYMYHLPDGDYGRGPSIAYFPTSSNTSTFNGLVSHEAGGHGFSKLADEYAYESMGTIPESVISDRKQMEPYGWWKNVDFTSDQSKVKWSKFLKDPRYAGQGLGCYEGGLTYWRGVWRPTDASIMRYNTGGYNAPCREAIWLRINKLAYGRSWTYNYEDFVKYDAVNLTPKAKATNEAKVLEAESARHGLPFQPLHEPVVINRDWRDAARGTGVSLRTGR